MKRNFFKIVAIIIFAVFTICNHINSQVSTVLKKTSKTLVKENIGKTAKANAKIYGRNSLERAVIRQAVKREAREQMTEHLKKMGIKSFFEYSNKKIVPKISQTKLSQAKINRNKSNYRNALRQRSYRKRNNASSEVLKKTKLGLYRNVNIIARKEGKEALDYLEQKYPEIYKLIKKMMHDGGPYENSYYWDNFVCEVGEKGELIIRNTRPEASNTAMLIKGNTIKAYSGCTQNATQQAPNSFLDYLLPNKKYIIDDGKYIFEVDNLGRTTFGQATYTQIPSLKTNLNKTRRDYVQQFKEGRGTDVDDAGHIFQKNQGGINELINLVPMNNSWQRNGAWRKFEQKEETIIKKALNANKKVISTRRLIYEGNSLRPSKILIEVFVDGKKVLSQMFDCP